MLDWLTYPLAFLLLLGVLVTFHEFGHYLIARLSGVQILRFSIGFGRAIWRKVDRHGTEFAIAVIPFGGYVRMLDDRDPEQRALLRPGARAYMDLHPKWRIAIALGGPVANFILAVLVYALLQLAGNLQPVPMTATPAPDSLVARAGLNSPAEIIAIDGVPTPVWENIGLALTDRLGETGTIVLRVRELDQRSPRDLDIPINRWHEGVGDPDVVRSLGLTPALLPLVGEVVPDTPAAAAGLRAGDWVTAANGQPVPGWSDFVDLIESHPGKSLNLDIVRSGTQLQLPVKPGARTTPEGGEQGFLGISPATHLVTATWLQAIPRGAAETWRKTLLIVDIMKKMVIGQVSVKNLSGPISIAQVAGDSAQYGWRQFLGLMGFLSISLGVLNLLPIPILDGGHVVFSSIEWLRGKPVSEQVQVWGVQIGLVLVGCMIIFATYNDVLRLF